MKVTKKICDIYIPIIWKFIYFKKGQKEKVDFWWCITGILFYKEMGLESLDHSVAITWLSDGGSPSPCLFPNTDSYITMGNDLFEFL